MYLRQTHGHQQCVHGCLVQARVEYARPIGRNFAVLHQHVAARNPHQVKPQEAVVHSIKPLCACHISSQRAHARASRTLLLGYGRTIFGPMSPRVTPRNGWCVSLSRNCTTNAWGPWSFPPSIRRAMTTACVTVRARPPGHHCNQTPTHREWS